MNNADVPVVPETRPVGFCRQCGRPLAESELRLVQGVIYCADHAPVTQPPATAPASPWAAPPPVAGASPGLAFLLGFIPGVGAIYNGQYGKGLVHVVIFGLLVTILSSGTSDLAPLFGLMLTAWFFYMAFEAYHTAKKRLRGLPVDEFSSVFPLQKGSGAGVAGAILIAVGILFLLVNFDVVRVYQIVKFWPVLLIAMGAFMLYSRLSAARKGSSPDQELTP